MKFQNFKSAHNYYNYPSSYRIGSISNTNGVIRSYSNGLNGDKYMFNNKIIYYKIKNDNIREKFRININNGKKIRFFKKIENGVDDLGLYKIDKFWKGYVKLIK